jgi:predicted DNA-binding protein (UPF0251 family)
MIFEALHATGGHHQKAAARLGISRRTLSRKLKVYGAQADSNLVDRVLAARGLADRGGAARGPADRGPAEVAR